MAKWLTPRLVRVAKTKENFCEEMSFENKKFERWNTAQPDLNTIIKSLDKIKDYFDEEQESLLEDYIRVKKVNLPDHLRYLYNSIDALKNYPDFIETLLHEQKATDVLKLVENTEKSITANLAKNATKVIMSHYGDAIDSVIDQVNEKDELQKVDNLIACLALVSANSHPDFSAKSSITIKISSNSDDEDIAQHEEWSIQMMIDRNRASPLVTRILTTEEDKLLASGRIGLGVTHLGADSKSDTEKGLLKELHGWVELIARKHALDPSVEIPELNEDDFKAYEKSEFWNYRKELQRKLFSVNETRKHLFATVRENVPPDLIDMVLAYFTDDSDEADMKSDPDIALKLYQLSTIQGYKPYRLDVGIFAYWIIDRIEKIEKRKQQLNSNETKPKTGNKTMENKQTNNSVAGRDIHNHIYQGNQNNRMVINNYKGKLIELQEIIESDNQADQALKDNIKELIDKDPNSIEEAEHINMWSNIKSGLKSLNESSKTVKIFNQAYTTACEAYQYLF